MPITEEQRQERRHHLGSSDMAAVLGVDPWRTSFDVWADKTGRLVEQKPTPAMERGNRYEYGVLDYAEDRLGPLERGVPLYLPGSPLAANVDAIVTATAEPVEAKLSQMIDQWGPEGTDRVPDQYIAQCHVHMLCRSRLDAAGGELPEADVCHLAAYLGGRDERLYVIPRNAELCRIIVDEAGKFWEHVQSDTPPAGAVGTPQILKLMRRVPEKIVAMDPEIVQAWLEAKAVANQAGKAKDAAEAAVLTALGDAEAALCGDLGALTYLESNRKGYTVEPSTYRTLRHKSKGL